MNFDLVIAFALIAGTENIPSQPPCPLHSLQAVAIQTEILSSADTWMFFNNQGEFVSDVVTIRSRYRDMVDAPPLSDRFRFPNADFCSSMKSMNRLYYTHIQGLQESYPEQFETINTILGETNDLWCAWDKVHDSYNDNYSVYYRRSRLKSLRKQIGWQNYFSGALPPPVPIWRFWIIGD